MTVTDAIRAGRFYLRALRDDMRDIYRACLVTILAASALTVLDEVADSLLEREVERYVKENAT